VLLFVLAFEAVAQEAVRGRIFHVQGNEVAITGREGFGQVQVDSLTDQMVFLNEGDMLQTGPGSFAELQFVPGGTVIKLAENTSLVFMNGDDPVFLSLLYGRIRLVTGSEERSFSIGTGDAVVELTRGDMGIDYIVRPDQFSPDSGGAARPRLQVYDFRGNAGIALLPNGSTLYQEGIFSVPAVPIPVNAREMVSLEIHSVLHFIERKPIHSDIVDYWTLHYFQGSPPLKMPDTTLPRFDVREPVATPVQSASQTGGRNLRMLLKNDAIIFGLALTGIGAGMQGYGLSSLYAGDYHTAKQMNTWGFLPLGMGLAFLVSAIFLNPVLP
jgi:hypothetical protein